ncbi:DUF695 domain-containing protein [Undibacterium sp. TJN19]|uniref:DUF695 domain-containing protein n=1 Tax=Undibacterium sp. TJN19 TaxID=3413055 RepID=UPI003BF1ECD0
MISFQLKFDIKTLLQKIFIFFCAFTITPSIFAQTWAVATSKHHADDRVIVIRYLNEFENGFDPKHYPDRVTLAWTYSGNKGMPSTDERMKMDKLEDTLQPLLTRDRLAELTMVSTGNNIRQWTYYAKSVNSFKSALNQVYKELPDLKIKLQNSRDSEWSAYKSFKASVKE